MFEQENRRATHLIILLCYTVFTVMLAGVSFYFEWEMGAVALLFLGLVASWTFHISGKIPEQMRLWLYFTLMMLGFFFYGIHESSVYDMAPVMIGLIMMFTMTELYSVIWLCVAVYYVTMCYDLLFVVGGTLEYTPLIVTRTVLHFAIVYLAGYLAKSIIRRRRMERRVTDGRIRELEETNRRTEDFLTNVSHELRTPINAVTGLTTVMLKNETNEEKKRDIHSIQKAGQRLFGQIEDILDYTEIDTGRMKVSEDTYMISSLVNDIVAGTRDIEREDAPELIFDVDADMPASFVGDGRKIKKIIRHLLENAVKFTKTGGVCVRIYALQKEYGVNLCIRVSDTGVGISDKDIEKITERFYQSDGGRSRRAGGLGLGLSIVYGMVAAMEGFIQIDSTVGSGTVVSVSIPQKVADDAPGMVASKREELCLAVFLRPEKYAVPQVRNYYDEMIANMARGLSLAVHRVYDAEELEKLNAAYQLTHVVTGVEEYTDNADCFEELDRRIEIIVAADEHYTPPQGSRVKLLRKPFYCLPFVNLLNAGSVPGAELASEKRMICPNISVLVVDDEPMNLMVSEGIFKDYHMVVKTADSGMKAIELCEREDFDLIFLDHMMPEMDGVETLKRLRKIRKENDRVLTVIAFTANAVSGAREMFLQEGFDEFVSKPIETLELERVLKKMLPKAAVLYVDEVNARYYTEDAADGENAGEDSLARLARAGFNTRSGLQYCRGDVEFYEELLTKFAQDAPRKQAELGAAYEKEDIGNYHIMVHALKSAARMVGADTLSEMAKRAEDAAKKKDVAYSRAHHKELMDEYDTVVWGIWQALGREEAASDEPVQEETTELSAMEFVRKLTALRKYLDTFEEERAEAAISDMSRSVYQGKAVGELLSGVRLDVEDFEFRSAAEKVDGLIRTVKGGEA